jgi:hypothetical protein
MALNKGPGPFRRAVFIHLSMLSCHTAAGHAAEPWARRACQREIESARLKAARPVCEAPRLRAGRKINECSDGGGGRRGPG